MKLNHDTFIPLRYLACQIHKQTDHMIIFKEELRPWTSSEGNCTLLTAWLKIQS